MNEGHPEPCVVPWALERVTLGGDLLEIGPGPGGANEALRRGVRSLTELANDPDLARRLAEYPDATFDLVASFAMMHHVPTPALQDELFAGIARVLRPGGVFFGVDSLGGPGFLRFHEGDVCVPLDPRTLADRLEAAGFVDADVAIRADGSRWVANVAEPDQARARVNERFRELYDSEDVRRLIAGDWAPQLLEPAPLGDDHLHLDAGIPWLIDHLHPPAGRLTVCQLDPAYMTEVAARHAGDETAVFDVDPTDLPFPSDRFSGATVALALMHLRSARAQDRTLAELARVLRPGTVLVVVNALDGSHFRRLNAGDRNTAIDPLTFPARLEAAGFTDVTTDLWSFPRHTGKAPPG